MYHPVFLTTDICVYIIFLALLLTVFFMWRSPQYHNVLQRIISKPIGVVSVIILGLYLSIALLDSIHYRSSAGNQQIVSVLDQLMSPLNKVSEQTYSAPFAYHLYTQQSIKQGDKVVRIYPHLKYVAVDINSPEKLRADISKRCWSALGWSLVYAIPVILILFFIFALLKKQGFINYTKNVFSGGPRFAGWFTVFIIYLIIFK